MNERIKDLVGQAKLMAEEDINKQISYNAELNAFAEKFAELIVRECWTTISPFIEDDKLAADALEEIKEHFGIK